MTTDFGSDGENVLQIRRTVLAGRGSHRDKINPGIGHGLRQRGGEQQTTVAVIGLNQGFEARLVNGDIPPFETSDFFGSYNSV